MKKLYFYATSDMHSDCTIDYYITWKGELTVKELVEIILSNATEWGYITKKDQNDMFRKIEIEYSHGKLLTSNFDEELLNKKVIRITANGGYTRMDYIMEVN